jgi:putative methionine-R-sulfoxide reductase with GAF domain
MKNPFELLLKIAVFVIALAVMVLLFVLPDTWWQPLLFCFTFSIIAGYLLVGGIIGTVMLILGTVMYAFLFIKAFAGELPMIPVVSGIVIMYACYFIVKNVGDTSAYLLSTANDSLKSLEGDYNSMIIERKSLSTALEANRLKLDKFVKLQTVFEKLKDHPDFSSKIRHMLKNIVELFHQDRSISLFLTKQDKVMKVMADKKDDLLVGERDVESLYLKNFDEFILNNKKSIIITDMAREIRFKAAPGENIRALISVPVFCKDQIAGILRVTSEESGVFNQEDLRFLDIIGGMIGKVLEVEQYA